MFLGFFEKIPVEDLVIVLFGLCALGLIVMPELIYVQDIYPNAPRANTMFKLTYQGYMLFAICMAYVFGKGLIDAVRLEHQAENPCIIVSQELQNHIEKLIDVNDLQHP